MLVTPSTPFHSDSTATSAVSDRRHSVDRSRLKRLHEELSPEGEQRHEKLMSAKYAGRTFSGPRTFTPKGQHTTGEHTGRTLSLAKTHLYGLDQLAASTSTSGIVASRKRTHQETFDGSSADSKGSTSGRFRAVSLSPHEAATGPAPSTSEAPAVKQTGNVHFTASPLVRPVPETPSRFVGTGSTATPMGSQLTLAIQAKKVRSGSVILAPHREGELLGTAKKAKKEETPEEMDSPFLSPASPPAWYSVKRRKGEAAAELKEAAAPPLLPAPAPAPKAVSVLSKGAATDPDSMSIFNPEKPADKVRGTVEDNILSGQSYKIFQKLTLAVNEHDEKELRKAVKAYAKLIKENSSRQPELYAYMYQKIDNQEIDRKYKNEIIKTFTIQLIDRLGSERSLKIFKGLISQEAPKQSKDSLFDPSSSPALVFMHNLINHLMPGIQGKISKLANDLHDPYSTETLLKFNPKQHIQTFLATFCKWVENCPKEIEGMNDLLGILAGSLEKTNGIKYRYRTFLLDFLKPSMIQAVSKSGSHPDRLEVVKMVWVELEKRVNNPGNYRISFNTYNLSRLEYLINPKS